MKPVGSAFDPIEAALADAIQRASVAGEWATVEALAQELRARRVALTRL